MIMLKKVLKTSETINFKDMQNSVKEFEILHLIDFPSICKTYGINIQENVEEEEKDEDEEITTVAVFLEFLDYNLKTFIDNNILSNSMKVKIAVEIAFGMSHLHKKGMIHRDLNIKNIMMNRSFEAKIINLGQAHLYESALNETSISVPLTKQIGDFQFMSPEMLNDDEDYDNKTDVYSFGVILFNMFTGKTPNLSIKDRINKVFPTFPSPSHSISKCCIELIKWCLSYEPNDRPSFDEILDFMEKNSFSLADEIDFDSISQRYQFLSKLNSFK